MSPRWTEHLPGSVSGTRPGPRRPARLRARSLLPNAYLGCVGVGRLPHQALAGVGEVSLAGVGASGGLGRVHTPATQRRPPLTEGTGKAVCKPARTRAKVTLQDSPQDSKTDTDFFGFLPKPLFPYIRSRETGFVRPGDVWRKAGVSATLSACVCMESRPV